MELTTDEFNVFRRLILGYSGLALTADKEYLVRSRIEPVAQKHQLSRFSEVIQKLQEGNDGRFRSDIVEAMATNETSFNRDGHPFDELRRSILPELIRMLDDRKQRSGIPFPRIRIWSCAASTGQEPWSIAMAVLDFLEQNSTLPWSADNFWILGSDLSEKALQSARAGRYSDWDLDRGITVDQKLRYFERQGDQWMISPALRRMVEFRQLNLLQNISDLSGFDLVFCRNLLIYFDEPTRVKVCRKLARSLNPGGILMIGAAEHLPPDLDPLFRQQQFGRTMVFVRTALNSGAD